MVKFVSRVSVLVLGALLLTALPAAAQQDLSQADLDRLQQAVNEIGRDVAALRERDSAAARRLQAELDELQDEVIYLRVRLRRERSVPRSEYVEVRDRLERLRTRASGTAAPSVPETTGPPDRTVPVGAELDVRLQARLNSGTAMVEDRFEATTLVDLSRNGRVVIPAGAVVRGVVTAVQSAGRVQRRASLSLSFDQITFGGRSHPIRATVTEAIEGEGVRGDAGRVGTGAAVGGIIGGIIGGVRGALTGILIGGGGTLIATEGEEVDLAPGTVLRMRFDSPLVVEQ
jgi:hypothetical protein